MAETTDDPSSPRPSRRPLYAVLAFSGVLGLWNAARYPPDGGYDASAHIAYADGLIEHFRLPHGTGEFHIPPAFYAIAGSADWVGRRIGLGEPHRVLQALDVVLLLVALALVWSTARMLWPARPHIAFAATAFLAFVPGLVRAAAMFHPELLDFVCSALACWLAVRLLRDAPSLARAAGVGAILGAGQLVRAFTLWTVGALAIAIGYSRRWRQLLVGLAVAALVPAPWYAHQAITYGHVFAFNRVAPAKPVLDRRPLSFYVGLGVPDVVTHPYRGHFVNRFVPTSYSELWGDYFGFWRWDGSHMTAGARRALGVQAIVGLLPTILALAGAVLLLRDARGDPGKLAIAALPPVALLGFLYFTVANPSPDGDVIKATYMLTAAGGWAIGFGLLVDRLRGRLRMGVVAALVVCALAELPFLVYH